MLRELRKAKGYQQKEIAGLLGITPQTYNGYEKGRNEPPIEVLVRISYLFDTPLDILVQRNRLDKDNDSASTTLAKLDEELADVQKAFKESPYADVPQLNTLLDALIKATDAAKALSSKSKQK